MRIPEFDTAMAKPRKRRTALEQFICDYEPSGRWRKPFREALRRLLVEVAGDGDIETVYQARIAGTPDYAWQNIGKEQYDRLRRSLVCEGTSPLVELRKIQQKQEEKPSEQVDSSTPPRWGDMGALSGSELPDSGGGEHNRSGG